MTVAIISFLFLVFNLGAFGEESNVFPPKSIPTLLRIPGAPPGEAATAPFETKSGTPSETESTTVSKMNADSKNPTPSKKKSEVRKAKRGEVKETEGSTAPERFEGNTILKSQYTLDGQSLEIDPD